MGVDARNVRWAIRRRGKVDEWRQWLSAMESGVFQGSTGRDWRDWDRRALFDRRANALAELWKHRASGADAVLVRVTRRPQ